MNLNEKLAKLTTDEAPGWKEKAERRKQNRGWLRKSAHIALTVLAELRRRGMTQKELAEKMGMSAQQVNKIVKGQENLTLETLDKLERALNIQLLHDGKQEATTVTGFTALPIEPKIFFASTHASIQQIYRSIKEIELLELNVERNRFFHQEFNIISGNLHTQFPIEGKEKWMNRLTEHS
jgi:transcriptional regulator with XRE-family HTH domain